MLVLPRRPRRSVLPLGQARLSTSPYPRLGDNYRESRPVSLWTRNFTIPTRRLQNISTNPATAANTEASGIKVSGPMYKRQPPWRVLPRRDPGSHSLTTFCGLLQRSWVTKPTRQLYCVYLAAGSGRVSMQNHCHSAARRPRALRRDSCTTGRNRQDNAAQLVTLTQLHFPNSRIIECQKE